MQFRLETYKNELNEKRQKNDVKSGKNIFYTKILSNTNIGIEFFKPNG